MKTNFINSLIKYFIEKYYYNVITQENQPLDFTQPSVSLIKDVNGTNILLEIVDADRCDSEQLIDSMRGGSSFLESISSKNFYIYKLFLFDGTPEQEKLHIIEQGQRDNPHDKKFLKCITVDIGSREVKKCFKVPHFDAHISKSIEKFFAANLGSRETSLQEITDLIALRQTDYDIEMKAKVPWVTYLLIAVNVAVFAILTFIAQRNGQKNYYNYLLYAWGSKVNDLIVQGQDWRLITPMFLHSNEVHLLLNCYSLYVLGSLVEKIFGHVKFTVIYFIAGFTGCVASFAFSTSNSVGASGAIFGLMGAMLYFSIKRPSLLRGSFGVNLITNLFINLAYGFMNSNIDNHAHIGGFIGGFLTTGAVYAIRQEGAKEKLRRLASAAALIVISAAVLFYGFNNGSSSAIRKVDNLDGYIQQEKYAEAEKLAEEILKNDISGMPKLRTLWDLSVSEINQEKYSEALEHSQQVKDLSDVDGSYLLGVIYYNTNEFEKAKTELEQAKSLGSTHTDDINLRLSDIKNRTGK